MLKTVQPRHICNIGNSRCRHSFHALTANSQYMEYTDNQTSIVFWDAPVTIRIDDYWISVKSTWLYYCHIWKTVLFHYLAIISIWMEEYWPVIFTDFFSFGYILDCLSIEQIIWLLKKWKCSSRICNNNDNDRSFRVLNYLYADGAFNIETHNTRIAWMVAHSQSWINCSSYKHGFGSFFCISCNHLKL